MDSWIWWLLLAIAGSLGGFLGGLVGIGGGIIFVVILPEALLAMGAPPNEVTQLTIANSLIVTTISAGISTYSHFKLGNLTLKPMAFLGGAAVLSSLAVTKFFVNSPYYSKGLFDSILLLVMSIILFRVLVFPTKNDGARSLSELKPNNAVGVGLFSGTLSSLSGLGGGIIIIPVLTNFLKFQVRGSTALSLSSIFISAGAATLASMLRQPIQPVNIWHTGLIIWPAALPLILGTVVFSKLGVKTSQKMAPNIIIRLFSLVMLVVILKKCWDIWG